MTETRGHQTINDRTDGWGPGIDKDLQPTEDAEMERTSARVARLKKERKVGNPGDTPDTDDRKRGYGDGFNPTGGADNGYGVNEDADWSVGQVALGTDYEVEYTGNDVDRTVNDPEISGANRPTVAWVYEDDENGWGTGFSEQGFVEDLEGEESGISRPANDLPNTETPGPIEFPAVGSKDERGDASVEWPGGS